MRKTKNQECEKEKKQNVWKSSSNERESLKEFWLNLKDSERASLVVLEKEAVIKRIKDQQKSACSCSACGRKRNVVEEELELLYDAYYDELEQYSIDSVHREVSHPHLSNHKKLYVQEELAGDDGFLLLI